MAKKPSAKQVLGTLNFHVCIPAGKKEWFCSSTEFPLVMAASPTPSTALRDCMGRTLIEIENILSLENCPLPIPGRAFSYPVKAARIR